MREEIQRKAVEIALNSKCGTLSIPIRSGKTKIGLEIASKFKKVLVSYPNNSIQESWTLDAEKFNYNIEHIVFTTHLSFSKHDLRVFDCVIIDEIQDFSVNNWSFLSLTVFNKVIGLSGTPPNQGEKLQYLKTYCPIIYEVLLDETVGTLQKDYEIIVHLLESSDKSDIPLKSGKTWSEKQKIQFWENKYNSSHNFMDMLRLIQSIQNSKTKFEHLKKLSIKLDRCLIFVETKKQCEDLGILSHYSGNKLSGENLDMFQNESISKLACVKQLSAGISFKNTNKAIILHCYASNNKAHQRIGRTLNLIDNTETKAEIYILCLKGTRDEQWVKKGLAEFDQSKIKYITI